MALKLTAGPVVEPVTLTEAKAHMRVEFADDDALIAGLVKAARECVESATNRRLITQSWCFYADKVPAPPQFILPLAPIQRVDWVRLWDASDVGTVLAAAAYLSDTVSEPARVLLTNASAITLRPYNAVEIAFTCGYGADGSAVPEPLRQAVKLLAAHWYENRIAVVDAGQVRFDELPMGVQYLLASYRLWGRQL